LRAELAKSQQEKVQLRAAVVRSKAEASKLEAAYMLQEGDLSKLQVAYEDMKIHTGRTESTLDRARAEIKRLQAYIQESGNTSTHDMQEQAAQLERQRLAIYNTAMAALTSTEEFIASRK
jgi:hypothetical protein